MSGTVDWSMKTAGRMAFCAVAGLAVGKVFNNHTFGIGTNVFVVNPINCAKAAAILIFAKRILELSFSKLTSKELIDLSLKTGFCALGGVVIGAIYASIFRVDQAIAMNAMAVTSVAYTLVPRIYIHLSRDKAKYKVVSALQGGVLMVAIIAFRRLNLIANVGTVVLGAITACYFSEYLSTSKPEANKKQSQAPSAQNSTARNSNSTPQRPNVTPQRPNATNRNPYATPEDIFEEFFGHKPNRRGQRGYSSQNNVSANEIPQHYREWMSLVKTDSKTIKNRVERLEKEHPLRNFYTVVTTQNTPEKVLGLGDDFNSKSKDAKIKTFTKACRTLSGQLHPDKYPTDDYTDKNGRVCPGVRERVIAEVLFKILQATRSAVDIQYGLGQVKSSK